MDRIIVVLFAYKRLDQTKRQVEDLLRLGYTSIYVFQDFCHEIQPLIFIHHNVTVVARNHNYGQFLNYHSAFIHLQNIYDIALVLEDDIVLNKKYNPPNNLNFAHINIGPTANYSSDGEISTWGYCINLRFYASVMGSVTFCGFLNSIFRSGRIYRRNFVVQYYYSIKKRLTWALVWQLSIDNTAGKVLESNYYYCSIVEQYFFDGENVSKRTNSSYLRMFIKNIILLPTLILWLLYTKKIKNLL